MEEQTANPTDDTQVDDSQLKSAAGDEAVTVDTDTSADSLSLKEINEITGMNYKDRDTALKSIKDMKSQAGKAADLEGKLKAAQADPKTTDEEVALLKEQLNQFQAKQEASDFYSANPDANRDLIETIVKANGMSREEAMQTDLYKNTVAKEPEKRTIAAPNNRVAQTQSKEFNPADHKGDADALARYVVDTHFNK